MKKKLRRLYLLAYSVVVGLLHLPIVFAKTAAGSKLFIHPPSDSNARTAPNGYVPARRSVYDSLHLDFSGLSRQAFDYARQGWERLKAEGKLLNESILSIIDFSRPSGEKRLFIIDLENYRLLYHTHVAHGQNSGREWATQFSNRNSSHMSSPGFYVTRETYQGRHGLSLRLEGLERGINDQAYSRSIVVHGASYVSESIAQRQGYIGRSHGCPAVPDELSTPIIQTIRNGSCLFIYHPSYVSQSPLLN